MAVGDRTEKRLIGPSVLGATNTLLGTVPTSRLWVTKQITVTNTNAIDVSFRLSIGSSILPSNCFFYNLPMAANDTIVFDTSLVLYVGENISGLSSIGAVNVVVTGWEKEV